MQNEKLIVLLVEDSPIIRERLMTMLQELKNVQRVFQAENYEEAVDILSLQPANVLLLDLGLPGKSGIDLLRAIDQNQWKLSIIIFTNQADEYYRKLCLSLGAHYFLDKTKDFDKIPALIADIQKN